MFIFFHYSSPDLIEQLFGCFLLLERHFRVIRTGRGASFTHPIHVASSAGVAGRISITTIVRRSHDRPAIAVKVDFGRGRPAPGETHRIYSPYLAAGGTERDRPTGLRAVSPAGVQIAAVISPPDDHFSTSPHCRVMDATTGCVGRAGGRPTIRPGIVSPAGVEIVV